MRNFFGPLVLGLACAAGAAAQTAWPDRPIKLVVGSSPGGSNDFVARAYGEELARVVGQPVVIDNRPGMGASIGVDYVAKAAPDGYTITIASPGPILVNPALDPRWAAAEKLVSVAKVTASPVVIAVNPKLGVKSVRELIEYARKNPGKLNTAHPGIGTPQHLAGILFNQMNGLDIVQVPFKSGGASVQSLVAGDTQMAFASPVSVLPLIKANRVVGLAVAQAERSALVPDLPSMTEAGLPTFKMDSWYGLFAPPGTPPDVVKKLFDATETVLRKPELRTLLASGGYQVSTLPTSADFGAFVREERKVWSKLARDSGARLE